MNARVPAEVFAPGEFLAEELESRGWSQVELSEILGRPPRLISEIIAGKRAITPETAMGLSAAFGTSPQYWMNLETSYQLSKARIANDEVTRRAALYRKFPVKELIKRGWVEASENVAVLEQRFCEFFKIEDVSDAPKFAHAPRATIVHDDATKISRLAWLNRAEHLAKAIGVGKYSAQALRDSIPALRACMEDLQGIRHASEVLGKCGVRLVVVEHLAGSKMDGACFWMGGSPVIALSQRYDRIDNFWFNLFHEIAHVLHGEGKEEAIYEVIEPNKAGLPPEEVRANDEAANYCVPTKELQGFIARTGPMYSKQSILGFALRLKVHPGIVVGQLHGHAAMPFSMHREMLERVRPIVIESILTDGFGNKLPL